MLSTNRLCSIQVAGIARCGRAGVRVTRAAVVLCALAGASGVFGPSSASGFCPNEALRTGPSASLPDCRAYEQVTPQNKSSAVQDMDPSSSVAIPAADGNRLALSTLVAFGPRPTSKGSFSIFTRTESGWQVESVPPRNAGSAWYQEPIFNADLTEMGVNSYTTTPLSPEQSFEVGPPGGPYSTTIATTPTNYERSGVADALVGASADFSRVFLDSTDHTLLSGHATGTVEGARDLYESEDGRLRRLVNVQSDGSLVSPCGAKFDAASEDGLKVVFASPDPEASRGEPGCGQAAQLYERVNGSDTVNVSEPNTGVVDPSGPQPVQFQGASADGSKVFFTTTTELTHDDEGRHDEELYEYNANANEGEKLTRISKGATEAAGAEVNELYVRVAKDGSEVYFYANVAPRLNDVYRYDTAATADKLHFIARAEGSFLEPATTGSTPNPGSPEEDQVTPDGRFFVFASEGALGSAENNPVQSDGEKSNEIFRYDNDTGNLTCVSCPGNGAPASGGASLTGLMFFTHDETPPITSVSEDGSYIFFQSNDELVPQDVNGRGFNIGSTTVLYPWTDVYEWHDGVISLISSGTSSQEALLIGASANGSDVFFMTHSQLVAQDTDSSTDIYDARVNGGFPPPTESAACLGDTCLNPPVASNDPTPAWSSFSGPGNPTAPSVAPKTQAKTTKCSKGRVRKKGRCVKQRGKGKTVRRAVKHNRGGLK
jgi:hypothetical protein